MAATPIKSGKKLTTETPEMLVDSIKNNFSSKSAQLSNSFDNIKNAEKDTVNNIKETGQSIKNAGKAIKDKIKKKEEPDATATDKALADKTEPLPDNAKKGDGTPATETTPDAPTNPVDNLTQSNYQAPKEFIGFDDDPSRPYKSTIYTDQITGGRGTQSMFNQFNVFSVAEVNKQSLSSKEYNSDLHYDMRADILNFVDPDSPNFSEDYNNIKPLESIEPTEANIIKAAREHSGTDHPLGSMPYSPIDFAYCKFYKKIPNNRQITLRRYPFPTYDSAKTADDEPMIPIAQMVTHFGEGTGNDTKDILKMSFGVNWKEIEASVQDVDGNERGFGAGVEGMFGGGKATSVLGGLFAVKRGDIGKWDGSKKEEQEWLKKQWGDQGAYWNQVYGPVNVVNKTHMRERGLKFQNEITLKFPYVARCWQGINPKIAMLDIIVNFLSTTYTNAKFWGGATRYFPNYQDQVGFLGSQKDFYGGDYDKYFGSVLGEMKGLGSSFLDGLTKMFSGGGSFDEVMGSLKNVGVNYGMGKLARQTRPHLLSIRSLLSGAPIGEWHLTIGNPMSPELVMGNMIVDDAGIEMWGDKLGFDDFPTEITFYVKLKHAKPRDQGDIESMLNLGAGRLSYAPLVKLPSQQNTMGDASDKGEQAQIDKRNNFLKTEKTVDGQSLIDKLDEDERGSYERIKKRIAGDWGEQYANSKQLIYLLDRTKGKF